MLKKEMEQKLKEYKEIILEVGRWAFPIQYNIDNTLSRGKLLFHIEGIQKTLNEKFYELGVNHE